MVASKRTTVRRAVITSGIIVGALVAAVQAQTRSASVSFIVQVTASDSSGTHSAMGLWRSEMRHQSLFSQFYAGELAAAPIRLRLPEAGELIVYPYSQIDNATSSESMPIDIFASRLDLRGADKVVTLSAIAQRPGMSASLKCEYDRTPSRIRAKGERGRMWECPAIIFSEEGSGNVARPAFSTDEKRLELLRTIKVKVTVVGP